MKKIFNITLCITIALLMVISFSSCNDNEGKISSSSNIGLTQNNTQQSENDPFGVVTLPQYEATSPVDGHEHIPATDPAVEATCTSAGKTEGSHCSVCGEILIAQKDTAKKEHRLGTLPAVEPTCSVEGKTEGYGCLDCDYAVVYQGSISTKPHTYTGIPYLAPTCSTEGHSGGRHCSVCGYIIEQPKIIPQTAHTLVRDEAVAETCNKEGKTLGYHCSVCNFVTVEQQTIPADPKKHVYVSNPEINPTGRKDGHTVGIHCSSCEQVIVEPTVLPALGVRSHKAYENDYGYIFLGKLPEGKKLQALYDNIDECAIKFYNDKDRDIEDTGIIAIVDYSAMDLTSAQAVTVWTIYRGDHPLYYWMSNMVGYSNSQLTIYAYEEFYLASERQKIDEALYSYMSVLSDKIPTDANEYQIAKTLHDEIVLGMNYAYKSNGEPEDAPWAHSVSGFFTRSAGVCETYAKVFELMLNYFDIDNVYVTGDAGGVKHAWNLVLMDDGEWYWFDLTWDDTPSTYPGYNYKYFCVSENKLIGGTPFSSSHIYSPSNEYEVNFVLTLPERAQKEYVENSASRN